VCPLMDVWRRLGHSYQANHLLKVWVTVFKINVL